MLKEKDIDLLFSVVIGDGHVCKVSENSYRIEIGHGEKQLDYLEWKMNLLNNSSIGNNSIKIHSQITSVHKLTNKRYLLYRIRKSSKDFKCVYDAYNDRSYDRIKKYLSNLKSDRSTAIWFMDDGSVIKRKRKHVDGSIYYNKPTLKLCTHSFSKKENEDILKWFKSRYLIDGRITHEHKGDKIYYYIYFNSNESYKLFRIMKPYIDQIESMKEKFSFFYEYYNI